MKNTARKLRAILVAMLAGLSISAYADPDPDFHIYICFGQSNMEGASNAESQDMTVSDRFKMMSTTTCGSRQLYQWYTATPPLARCNTGLCPADYFGRTLVEKLNPNIRVGVIVVAVAGADIQIFEQSGYQSYLSSAADWLKSAASAYGDNCYKRIIDCAKKAQEDGVIKGVLVHQGESNTGQSTWPNRLKAIYESMLSDLGLNGSDVPLLVGETRRDGSCSSHNNIIAQVPNVISNSYVISSQGLQAKSNDQYHFSAQGYRDFGKRYAEQMLKLLPASDLADGSGDGGETGGETESKLTPYNGTPFAIPGKIEAEEFDLGGEGVAYHDNDEQNRNGGSRNEGVDMSNTAIGYTQSGEWLKYSVEVQADGNYDIYAYVASGAQGSSFQLLMDDEEITDVVSVPNTGDWDTYETVKAGTAALEKGAHVLQLKITGDWLDMDYMEFKALAQTDVQMVGADGSLSGCYAVFDVLGNQLDDVTVAAGQFNLKRGLYFLRNKQTGKTQKILITK